MTIETFFPGHELSLSKKRHAIRHPFFISKFFNATIYIPDLKHFSTKDLMIIQAELLLYTSHSSFKPSPLIKQFSDALNGLLYSQQQKLLKLDAEIAKKQQQREELKNQISYYIKCNPGLVASYEKCKYKCSVCFSTAFKLLPKELYSVFLKEVNEKMEAYK